MAELLIVVAIITILAGVGFIAVQNHQRSLAQAERNTIAKEIYFAAQNHLAMAESQGYLGVTSYGTVEDANKNIYYAVNNGSAPTQGSMLDLMLPFGSIDETVRSGGSYLIRYQVDPAIVLDVFYCSTNGKPEEYNHTISGDDYSSFLGYKNNGMPGSGYVVGYYGGVEAGLIGDYNVVKAPEVNVKNDDRLVVEVTDMTPDGTQAHNENGELKDVSTYLELIITGETVEGKTAKCVILLNNPDVQNERVKKVGNVYTVVLDDITTDGLHFADLNEDAGEDNNPTIWFMSDLESGTTPTFKPGEDITVEAVAFSNSTFTNIAYSSAKTTNSLFADDVSTDGTVDHTEVLIGSFRHLENLDPAISGLDTTLGIQEARQTADLYWNTVEIETDDGKKTYTGFVETIKGAKGSTDAIQVYNLEGTGSGANCYLPVSPTYALAYSGLSEGDPDAQNSDAQTAKAHTITGVKVGTADAAYAGTGGLFGAPTAALTVSDLALIDFDIHATGNAGALAGTLPSGSEVSNVIAYNSADFDSATATVASTGTVAAAGSAGGLIGSMTGANIEKCAAALIVSSAGKDAGGLIGTSTGSSTVSNSYSGGHVKAAASTGGAVEYDATALNVTAESGNAGGLIGSAGQAEISGCYSTCSVKGAVAGGLVGDAGSTIEDSYCTGLVVGASTSSKIGAFAGQLTVKPEECYYFEIINPIDTNGVITYMPSVSGATEETYDADELQPLDSTATVYNDFVGTGALAAAVPYSAALADYSEYPLRPLSDVTAKATATAAADFVATHYGDWPVPEAFVVNTK